MDCVPGSNLGVAHPYELIGEVCCLLRAIYGSFICYSLFNEWVGGLVKVLVVFLPVFRAGRVVRVRRGL